MSSQRAKPGNTDAHRAGAAGSGADAAGLAGDDLAAGLEATVAAYLRGHPDFFERNPDTLVDLRVPHAPGGAVSLIEHQVKVLRRQLDTERGRLAHLITRAREYESLATRLHGLVLQIIPVTELAGLCGVLDAALRREFSAAAVTLKLFPLDPEGADADPLCTAFRGFLEREHALCGPLEADKNGILFGDAGAEVQSAALVPIRAEGRSGVLAIGAADPGRFTPEMGTDLLDRLGEIVSAKLRALGGGADGEHEPICPPAVLAVVAGSEPEAAAEPAVGEETGPLFAEESAQAGPARD